MTTPAVLLLSPGMLRWSEADFGLPHLVALGGYVRERTGVRVELVDLGYENTDGPGLARLLDGLGPLRVVGVSCYSSFDLPRCVSLGRMLKARYPEATLVAGGYHASAVPGDLHGEGLPFDVVVTGEAEVGFAAVVEEALGGNVTPGVRASPRIEALDALPPYAWDLLDRYWPRATTLGRKLQVYLSRGCAYHCTFCMERSKSGVAWRAFSPERALDELRRLARHTDLSRWVVNVADPLFGFQRAWRREVLDGIVREGLRPQQFWTLTRSDDLDADDVALLARARFAIGIGLESGSPRMLRLMQKGNHPDAYLDAMRRLATLSRAHGLTWAANVIVGHPGETPETLRETHTFLRELYLSAPETCGWLSIDPFRLYPGSDTHTARARWEAEHGARFHHPAWWTSWYDGPFRAQHVEPSATLSYEERVRFLHDAYAPLVGEVQARFRGQGRDVDRVFARSMQEQVDLLSPAARDEHLAKGRAAVRGAGRGSGGDGIATLAVPLGVNVRDAGTVRREHAVRRLLDDGTLRTAALVEALLEVDPARWLPPEVVEGHYADRAHVPAVEGHVPLVVGMRTLALGLEALAPAAGDTVADLTAACGYVPALLARLVGPSGRVIAVHPGPLPAGPSPGAPVELVAGDPTALLRAAVSVDGLWIGAALPRFPGALAEALRERGGRAVTALGPRFGAQDLVVLTGGAGFKGGRLDERRLARVRLPVLGGEGGWVATPAAAHATGPAVRFERAEGPALAMYTLAHVDLGADAANHHDPALPPAPWAADLAARWAGAPRRLPILAACLLHDDVAALLHALRRPGPASSPADRALCAALADAAVSAEPAFRAAWEADADAHRARGDALERELGGVLTTLRRAAWRSRGEPPPLRVLHAPALRGAARATRGPAGHVVATDLLQPTDHVLCQVLHEEVHAVTDALLDPGLAPDTRVGSAGWEAHVEREDVAILATAALLDAYAPAWRPAFDRWCRALGREVVGEIEVDEGLEAP